MIFRPSSSHRLTVPYIQQRNEGECLAACAAMVFGDFDLAWFEQDEAYAVLAP